MDSQGEPVEVDMRSPDRLIELAAEMEAPLERMLKFRQIVDRYERGRDSKLGEIRQALEKRNKTQDDLRYEMRAHPDFKTYLEEWDKAEKEYIKARVAFDTLKNAFDALQSALSFDREHMKRFQT